MRLRKQLVVQHGRHSTFVIVLCKQNLLPQHKRLRQPELQLLVQRENATDRPLPGGFNQGDRLQISAHKQQRDRFHAGVSLSICLLAKSMRMLRIPRL